MMAGADFVDLLDRQGPAGGDDPVTLVMLEAVRDFREATGQMMWR